MSGGTARKRSGTAVRVNGQISFAFHFVMVAVLEGDG